MLRLEKITKVYEVADQKVHALREVDMEFRNSEFVSILGPSGCGKTTLLNIVGGLDRYTTGDLIINGKSTKDFKDKDWDNYRNHRVGFVFQSYNLIPHQTVLENVELALTLSGVSRKEREQRAIEVLKKVGLGDKIKNRPSQLSGGQMQRVAIARALVNDPEIILADEPTGALDSVTSVQIMELLKEISKDRLIIMVTHNPELAEKYSTRIIRLFDGQVEGDTMPLSDKEREQEIEKEKQENELLEEQSKDKKFKPKKTKMNFFTALALSFKNLLTKKGRTLLVAFAGSIGIIGIALVLAISSGFSTYISRSQEDTLSTYPITVEAKNIDFSSIITQMFLGGDDDKKVDHDKTNVYPKDSISSMMNNVGQNLSTNNLEKFYKYLNDNYDDIKDHVSAIQYTYDIGMSFYSESGNPVQPNSPALMQMIIKYALYFFAEKSNVEIQQTADGGVIITTTENTSYRFMEGYKELADITTSLKNTGRAELTSDKVLSLVFAILGFSGSGSVSSMASSQVFTSMNVISEMLNNDELLKTQYELIAGSFIQSKNQAILVLDKNNELDDYILYALGLISEEEMNRSMQALVKNQEYVSAISYESIIGKKYKVLINADYYVDDPEAGFVDFRLFNVEKEINGEDNRFYNKTKYQTYYAQAIMNCTNEIEIAGIVRQKESTRVGSISSGLVYSHLLTEGMVEYTNNSRAVAEGKIEETKLDVPDSILIYVNTFKSKDNVKAFIEKYNKTAENGDEISYSDMVGEIMSTVSTIISAITYILIAFVGVSLIVSSIMIGIITYISVIERTKEIGVLRSVGASKRDVKRVFTAENFIIGLVSGVFGILISLILTIPINIVLNHYTGLGAIATLPVLGAVILVLISIFLTWIAGLIPARAAAKKDPVIALREN